MGDAGLRQRLVNGQLGGHDGVVGGGEHGIHTGGDQAFNGHLNLSGGGAGGIHIGNSPGVQVGLGIRDGGGGGILAQVIQQADLVGIGVGGKHQIQQRVGVQEVGGAGDVRAGSLQGLHQTGGDGIGNGGEDHGDTVTLGHGLHPHGNRGSHTDHQVHFFGEEIGDDLLHDGGIGHAVVFQNLEGHALLLGDEVKLGFDVFNDLIQGGILDEIADADFEFGLLGGGGYSGQGDKHCQGKQQGNKLLHNKISFNYNIFGL